MAGLMLLILELTCSTGFLFFFWKQELHSINFFLTTVLPQLLKIKHWSLIIEFFPIFSFCFSFNVTLINNKVTATEYQ